MELWLGSFAQIGYPFLMEVDFSQDRGRMFGQFGQVYDNPTQVVNHTLLQQMHTDIGHRCNPTSSQKAICRWAK